MSRSYINCNIDKLRRFFKWAVSEQLVPVAAEHLAGDRCFAFYIMQPEIGTRKSVMLTVAKADEDAVNNTGVEPTELVGKTVALGVRMPVKDGKPQPHPDDVAYIKSLKAGMSIRVKIFAVRGSMKSLRMQGPGEPAKDGSQ